MVLDTNAYRSLHDGQFGTMLGLEARHGIGRFADPWVLMELLAHLADPADAHFQSCRRAARRFWVRCVGGPPDQPHGIMYDSESQLIRLITGQGLPAHDAALDDMLNLLDAVARTPDGQALSPIQPGLRSVADHVAQQEDLLIEKFIRLRETIARLLGKVPEERGERARTRASAMRELESNIFRRAIATTLIKGAYEDVNQPVPDPIPEPLFQQVLTAGAVGITFYLQLLRKAIYDGADLTASRTRNLMWDQRISYNIGPSLAGGPIWLVTNDPAFKRAAQVNEYQERVKTVDEYLALLSATGTN